MEREEQERIAFDQPAFARHQRGRARCHYALSEGLPQGHPGDAAAGAAA